MSSTTNTERTAVEQNRSKVEAEMVQAATRSMCRHRPGFAHGIRRGLNHGPRVGGGPYTF